MKTIEELQGELDAINAQRDELGGRAKATAREIEAQRAILQVAAMPESERARLRQALDAVGVESAENVTGGSVT